MDRIREAVAKLSDSEFADFTDYLADENHIDGVRNESWFEHIRPLFDQNDNTEVADDVWPTLHKIFDERA